MALIGCGAVAERCHLPAASITSGVTISTLVDKNVSRAERLARRFGIHHVTDDYRSIVGDVQGALVALPNSLHAPVTLDLLERGIHVLVEKPMALTARDCQEMISAAAKTGSVLAVGLVRRFYPATQFIYKAIKNRIIGGISEFDFREGRRFDWPLVSDYLFRKNSAGGGVLADIGVHLLDLVLWWLGDCGVVEYRDDAMGGVEAECEILLRTNRNASGTVEMSRTRSLRNSFILRGELGSLEVGTGYDSTIRIRWEDRDSDIVGGLSPDVSLTSFLEVFRRQLDNFANAVLGREEALVPGTEGKRSVELMESCYALRHPLMLPWATWPPMESGSN